MYVDYHIIDDKEAIAINYKGESIKITGSNKQDIEKLILLSNKIEGLEDKNSLQKEELITLPSKRKYRIVELVILLISEIPFSLLLILILQLGFTIPYVILDLILAAVVVSGIIPIKSSINFIKEYRTLEKEYKELLNKGIEEQEELKKEFSDLMTKIKVEEKRNEKKEELVKAYKEGLKNEADFSFDYEDVKTLKLKGENLWKKWILMK